MQSLKSTQIICVKLHQHPEIHVDVKHQMLVMSLLATLLKDQQNSNYDYHEHLHQPLIVHQERALLKICQLN